MSPVIFMCHVATNVRYRTHEPVTLLFCDSLVYVFLFIFKPLNAELNPICHLLALLGAHYIFHVSG